MPPKHKKEVPVKAQSRSAKYKQKMKATDPEKYKCYLAKEAARKKRLRSQLSEESKIIQREKTRLRVEKLRERKKAEKQNEVRKQFQKRIKDMSYEERKEYDRVRKAESRSKISYQKKERVCERKKNYMEIAKKKQFIKPKTNKVKLTESISSPVLTLKIRKQRPKSQSKYACAIKNLIKACFPKKKTCP